MCCIIENLDQILDSINSKRASNGDRVIKVADWSAFLSGSSTNDVKQNWIKQIRNRQCISREKALILLGALNAVLRSLDMPLLDINVIVCEKQN